MTLFLAGDVMTGRGIDQILPHPSDPRLHEGYVDSALEYVALAGKTSGKIVQPADFRYIWGESLEELERFAPDVRIVNLETSVTTSEFHYPKGINYRMHPANVACLTAAKLDCCVLANNHMLDWGRAGLVETLDTLHGAGLSTAGAGRDVREALQPAVHQMGASRLLIFAAATPDSGIPPQWAAAGGRPGVALLPALSSEAVAEFAARVHAIKQAGDLVLISVHWGGNWGYEVPRAQRDFAHRLIDLGAADVVHGHSSHHPKPIEVYNQRLILYGCGDFLNDYEGISGYEEFRGNLVLMYFVTMEAVTGKLSKVTMVPLQLKQFRLQRPAAQDADWLRETLNREGEWTGTKIVPGPENTLLLQW